MARNQKAEFIRAVHAFNPALAGLPGTSSARQHIKNKIAEYDAKGGGLWNYDNLYRTVDSVVKGMPINQAIDFLAGLDGVGEAAAKVAIFKGLCDVMPIGVAQSVEVGGRIIPLKGGKSINVRPDFSFKLADRVVCVLVYPNAEPALKQQQREAIVNVLARPLPLMNHPHFLLLAEYPQIGSKRVFSTEEFAFEYRPENECFSEHLEEFFSISGLVSDTDDLFG